MGHDDQRNVTALDVIDRIRAEIDAPAVASTDSALAARMARIQTMQRAYRVEPLGGRLLPIKKPIHWLVASSFDRQASVIESLLTVVEDLCHEVQRLNRSVSHLEAQLVGAAKPEPGGVSPAGSLPRVRSVADDPELADSVNAVLNVCAEMMEPERVLLYSLVFALKPSACLEIGTFRGGSSAIICRALDDNGDGSLVCVDPEPRIPEDVWTTIQHRATLVQGASPGALAEASDIVSGGFDFALIDGDHGYQGALDDIEGVLDFLEDGAHIVLHDCHYYEVKNAIKDALERHPDNLIDCGIVSVTDNPQEGEHAFVEGNRVIWGGLYLLRFVRDSATGG
jgi:predicted O-methyltransferase YrrM